MEEKAKVKVKVRVLRNKENFYIQYGRGAEFEKIRITSLPYSVRALLNTLTSEEFEADIEGLRIELDLD